MGNSKFFLGNINIKGLKLGNSDVKAYLGDTLLYPLSKSIEDAVVSCAVATYNGSNQTAQSITVTLSGVTLVENTDYTVTQNTGGTNAGTYPVVVTGMGNYEGTANGTFTIDKVTPTVTAPTAKVLTYNGSAQELVNAGSTNFGTLKYSLDGTTYTTTIPTATNYGSYTVYYKVDGNSNVNSVAAQTVACSINEKQVTATVVLSQTAYTYNGSACQPTVTVKDGTTVIDPSEYTVTYSNNVNAGTATVTISDNVGGNYEVIGSTTFTINKADPTYTAPTTKTGLVYNASAQALLNGGSATGGTIYYSSDGSTWGTAIPSGTNATSYTSYWKITGDANHNDKASASISTTIAKAAGSVTTTPVNNNYTYNGTARAVASAGSGTGTMYYRLGTSGSFSTTMPTMTNAGSDTLYYYAAASTNYEQSSTGSIAVSVQKANISPTVSISNWTYGGTASNPSVAGNSGSGTVTYYYKLSTASSWSTTKPSNAGDYNIRADIAATTNYNSGTCTSNFTINKANSSLSFAVTSITVGKGETKTNAVTVNAGDGTVTYSSNNTTAVTVNNSGTITGVGVGNATITANISSTNNYNSASTSYTASCALVLTTKFNVTDTSSPTRIASATTSFTSIEIDGVTVSPRTGYTFSTTGEHTVKYKLKGTSIENYALARTTSLTSIVIPNGVTSIGESTFLDCSGLTSIDIPDSVTSIGNLAFLRCRNIRSLDIGSGLTSFVIGLNYSSFGGCAFDYITVDSNNTTFDSRNNCNAIIETSTNKLLLGSSSTVIPNSVTSIGDMAFQNCSGLTSVNIPSGVTSIGVKAFYSCISLTSINIPNAITEIKDRLCENCTSLSSITIPSGITSIGYWAFENCNSLTEIIVEATTPPTLGSGTFMNTNNCPIYVPCESVDTYKAASGWSTHASRIQAIAGSCPTIVTAKYNVTSTSSPTQIGYNQYISGFSAIEIDGVVQPSVVSAYTFSTTGEHTVKYTLTDPTSIGERAFSGCTSLTSIDIPSGVTSIGGAFAYCRSLTSCTIGSGVTSIGAEAFYRCSSLTSIVIPSGVTSIGEYSFYECSGLTSIDIPNSVTSIGFAAFTYCTSLTSCTIGSGVTNINYQAFYGCSDLTSIVSSAATAPTIQSSTFRYIKTGGTLTVPIGSSGYDVWMGTGNYYLGLYNWTKVEQ